MASELGYNAKKYSAVLRASRASFQNPPFRRVLPIRANPHPHPNFPELRGLIPSMKLLVDFFPIVLFFAAYKLADIYVATLAAIVGAASTCESIQMPSLSGLGGSKCQNALHSMSP